MTPVLLILGVAPFAAVGTDLWFAAITKSVRSGFSHSNGQIDWRIGRRLWLGSLPTSLVLLALMALMQLENSKTTLLETLIATLVLLTALGLALKSSFHSAGRISRISDETRFKSIQRPLTIISGVVLGSLVTITSVGAGVLGVVVLSYLYPLRMTYRRLVSTDVAHAIPLALLAGLGHLLGGNVDCKLLLNILVGSVSAVIVGATLANQISDFVLRYFLIVILFLAGSNLLVSTLQRG